MPNRTVMAAIAAIICIPLAFALLGTDQHVGLVIGIVLVVVGLVIGASARARA